MSFTEVTPQEQPSPDAVFDMSDPFAREEADAAAAIARADQMVKGEMPTIEIPADMMLELPRGLYHHGTWLTRVELRELTGEDEEILARYRTPADYFDGVLACGVAGLGVIRFADIPYEERQDMINGLTIGEREQIYLAICRTTFGRYKEINHTCELCGAKTSITLDLAEDFPSPEMEDPHRPHYVYKTGKGKELHYRLPVGADQGEVMRGNLSTAQANTKIISRCVFEVDDSPVVDPNGFAKQLSMRDRDELIKQMMEHQPQPDMTVKFSCAGCSFDTEVFVRWDWLFRP